MKRTIRKRFWLEAGMAATTGTLFVVTLLWRNWIELVFRVELDEGNGSLEWLIVATLFVVTVTLFLFARRDWRVAQTTLGLHSQSAPSRE